MLRIHGYVYSGMLQNAREYGTSLIYRIHARKLGNLTGRFNLTSRFNVTSPQRECS